MVCNHKEPDHWNYERVDAGFWDNEPEYDWVFVTGQSWCEDIDTGRYRCTKCNKIMYYTGLWREYFEEGKPCPGSDLYEQQHGPGARLAALKNKKGEK